MRRTPEFSPISDEDRWFLSLIGGGAYLSGILTIGVRWYWSRFQDDGLMWFITIPVWFCLVAFCLAEFVTCLIFVVAKHRHGGWVMFLTFGALTAGVGLLAAFNP